jgi:hypothetical protein
MEATNFYASKVTEPSLNADPRDLRDNPLLDRTAQVDQRFAAEQHEAAQRKLRQARRSLWLASGSREHAISARPCPVCDAAPHAACTQEGRPRKRSHIETSP